MRSEDTGEGEKPPKQQRALLAHNLWEREREREGGHPPNRKRRGGAPQTATRVPHALHTGD